MKTLLVYYSVQDCTTQLFKHCANDANFDTYAIRERYFCSGSTRLCRALLGRGLAIEKSELDFQAYGSIIIVSQLTMGYLPAALNAFLQTNNLIDLSISCLVIHNGKKLPKHIDSTLRKRIHLSGGRYHGLVSIPFAEIKKHTISEKAVLEKLTTVIA